jgi:hypothetical protein
MPCAVPEWAVRLTYIIPQRPQVGQTYRKKALCEQGWWGLDLPRAVVAILPINDRKDVATGEGCAFPF